MDLKELRKGFDRLIPIAPLLFCLACSGCVTSRAIANRALRAPNRHIKLPGEFKQLDVVLSTNFPIEQISVGPPPATLQLAVLEPGDYDAKINTAIIPRHPQRRGDTNDYDFNFSFTFLRYSPKPEPETNGGRGTIFLLHGYGLNKETMLPWGLVLAEAGYRVVLVDLRGHGHSTGDHIYFGGIERTDLVQCLDALLQRRVCKGPVGVLGISYGAALALQWAAIDPRVQSVVAISPYPDPRAAADRYLKTFAPNLSRRTDRKVAASVASRLAAFPDLATETAIRRVKYPILFVRGEHDEVCLREDLTHFQAAAPPGSEVKEVPLANHLMTGMCISQLRVPVTDWFHTQLAEE